MSNFRAFKYVEFQGFNFNFFIFSMKCGGNLQEIDKFCPFINSGINIDFACKCIGM